MSTECLNDTLSRLILQSFPGFKQSGRRFVVALSGGLDSSCLLLALKHFCQKWPKCQLSALHVEHGLQKNSPAWAEHCQELCASLDIPLKLITLNLNPKSTANMEATARVARWEAFLTHVGPESVLVLGHHLDDAIETMLQRALRGSGLLGSCGMQVLADRQGLQIFRPLLGHSRSSLKRYAQTHSLDWIEDPSNTNTEHDRNWLRQKLLPLLETRWPDYRARLKTHLDNLQQDNSTLKHAMHTHRKACQIRFMGQEAIDAGELMGLEAGMQHYLLRNLVLAKGHYPPSRKQLEHFCKQIQCQAHAKKPSLHCQNSTLVLERGVIYCLEARWLTRQPSSAEVLLNDTLTQPEQYPIFETPCLRVFASSHLKHWLIKEQDILQAQLIMPAASKLLALGFTHKRMKTLRQSLRLPSWAWPHTPCLLVTDKSSGKTYLLALGERNARAPKHTDNASIARFLSAKHSNILTCQLY